MNRIDQLLAAVIEARAHVVRQQFAGKHKQDIDDAVDWLAKWSGLVDWAMEQPRQRAIRWDEPFGGYNER